MPPSDDELDTIIGILNAGGFTEPEPEAGPRPQPPPPPAHRVLWFEVGTILCLWIAIFGYLLAWLLLRLPL